MTTEGDLISFEAGVDLLPGPVIVIDHEHKITYASPPAEALFGGELVGRSVHELVPAAFAPQHRKHIDGKLDDWAEAEQAGQTILRQRMGKARIFEGHTLAGETVQLDIRIGPGVPGSRSAVAFISPVDELIAAQERAERLERDRAKAEAEAEQLQIELEATRETQLTEARTKVIYVMVGAICGIVVVAGLLTAVTQLASDGFEQLAVLAISNIAAVTGGYLGARAEQDRRRS